MSRAFMKENDAWGRCPSRNRDCMFADRDGSCGLKACKYDGGPTEVQESRAEKKKTPPPPVRPVERAHVEVDLTKIGLGTPVFHEVFGAGVVKQLGKTAVMVAFNGEEKRFQFPGAFQQGFLRLEK